MLIVKSSLKTAKKDLYVVKKVKKMPGGKKYRAYYRSGYFYEIGDVKKAKMGLLLKIHSQAHIGIHALIDGYDNIWTTGYLVGSDEYLKNALLICKIPKGSRYYIGFRGDIITNCLEIVEEANVIKPHTSKLNMLTGVKRAFKYIEEKYGKQTY